jgi:hypothetical protein
VLLFLVKILSPRGTAGCYFGAGATESMWLTLNTKIYGKYGVKVKIFVEIENTIG